MGGVGGWMYMVWRCADICGCVGYVHMGRRLVSGCECVEKVSGRIVCACLEGMGLCGVGGARLVRDRCV